MYPSHFTTTTFVTITLLTLAAATPLGQVPEFTYEDLDAAISNKPTLIVFDISAMPPEETWDIRSDAPQRVVDNLREKASNEVDIHIIHHGPWSALRNLCEIEEVTLVAEKGRWVRPAFSVEWEVKNLSPETVKRELSVLLRDTHPGTQILEFNSLDNYFPIQYDPDIFERDGQQGQLKQALEQFAREKGYHVNHDPSTRTFQMVDNYSAKNYVQNLLETQKFHSGISFCGPENEAVHQVMNDRKFTSVMIDDIAHHETDAQFKKLSTVELLDIIEY